MNQKGFVGIIFLGAFLLLSSIMGGYFIYTNNNQLTGFLPGPLKNLPVNIAPSASSPSAKPQASPTSIPTTKSQTNNSVGQKVNPTNAPSPTPTPAFRKITLAGFSYEDRNDDGVMNSDDPKLPYMSFFLYDSYKPAEQISTVFSDVEGNFSISLDVRGSLIIKPTSYNNFRPKGDSQQFSSSNSSIQFGFRSASAPVSNQVGIIEGDIFNDINQNNSKDSAEQGVYFYKLYLIDDQGNYYENTSQYAQATDASGHFKYQNLPTGRSYTIRLSNPTSDYIITRPETIITLTNNSTQDTNVQIPVFKN